MKELVYNNASGEYNKLLSDYEIQYRTFWDKKISLLNATLVNINVKIYK